jgi:hypothetical protein
MLLREDYICNRLERVSRNIAYIKSIMDSEPFDEDILTNLASLQAEHVELMSQMIKLEGNKPNIKNNIYKVKKHSKLAQNNKRGEQLSLF